MINCLKADFYRILKGKTFYILLAVLAGLSLFSVIIFKLAGDLLGGIFDASASPGKELFIQGLGGNSILLAAIFTSIFICSDFASGMMKNYISGNVSRTKILFSKLIVCLTVATILLFAESIFFGSLGSIFFGYGKFAAVNILEYLVKFLLVLFLLAAYISIFIFIAFGIRSIGGVVSINILIVLLLSTLLSLLTSIPSLKNIGDYWLQGNVTYATLSIYPKELTDHLLSIILTGAVYTTLFLPSAYMLFRFRDVK